MAEFQVEERLVPLERGSSVRKMFRLIGEQDVATEEGEGEGEGEHGK